MTIGRMEEAVSRASAWDDASTEAAATRPPVRGPPQGGSVRHLGAEHPDPRPGRHRGMHRQSDDRRLGTGPLFAALPRR